MATKRITEVQTSVPLTAAYLLVTQDETEDGEVVHSLRRVPMQNAMEEVGNKTVVTMLSLTNTWTGEGPYAQVVGVSGVTVADSALVDLQPDAAVLAQLISDGVTSIWVQNDSGTLTVYTAGAAPSVAFSIQCTITNTAPALTGIAVTTMPLMTEYEFAAELNLQGLVVTATYTDNSTAPVTASCIFTPPEGTVLGSEGTHTIAVEYSENAIAVATSFNVTVEAMA